MNKSPKPKRKVTVKRKLIRTLEAELEHVRGGVIDEDWFPPTLRFGTDKNHNQRLRA